MTIMQISPTQIRMSTLIPLVWLRWIMQELDVPDDNRNVRRIPMIMCFFYCFDQIFIITRSCYFPLKFTATSRLILFSVAVIVKIPNMIQVIHSSFSAHNPASFLIGGHAVGLDAACATRSFTSARLALLNRSRSPTKMCIRDSQGPA